MKSFDPTLASSGQTLGLSNTYIFWRIRMPACRQGILAGAVLAFARALGEYGATSMLIGYTPGRTATISTTVYQLWRTNDEMGALRWVLVNLAISTVVLLAVTCWRTGRRGGEKMSLRGGTSTKSWEPSPWTWPWRQAWKSRRCWACWAPLAAEKLYVKVHCRYRNTGSRPNCVGWGDAV